MRNTCRLTPRECQAENAWRAPREGAMNKEDDADPADHRVAIRNMAFELAESGIFDEWEAIRLALRTRFHAVHLHHIFASPFCRLDLDHRCRAARTNGSRTGADPVLNGSREHINSCPLGSRMPASGRSMTCPEGRRHVGPAQLKAVSGHAGGISALLADGGERTAAQLAQQLGVAQREVQRALRSMLANGEVHVARRTPRSMHGRSARIFASGPQAARGGNADPETTSRWPQADTFVLQAMDALARRR